MSIPARKVETPDPVTAEFTLNGAPLRLDLSGVVLWRAERLLIVADLHLEKGASYAARGTLLPPYDTDATLEALHDAVLRHDPRRVVALGDSFHDTRVSARLPQAHRDRLGAMMAGRDWVWVAGNHDPVPPDGLGGDFAEQLAIGPLVLRHEPSTVRNATSEGELAGHLHPSARINVRGRNLRRRCLIGDGTRAILPAFGAYTGGLDVRDPAFAGLFDAERTCAWMLGSRAVHKVTGRRLGYGR